MFADIADIINDAETRIEINSAFAELVDPYIPFKTGALATNYDITIDGIKYNQPYAKEVYEEQVPHNPQYHPLATDHWGEAMLRDRGDEFNARVSEIIARRLKDGSR